MRKAIAVFSILLATGANAAPLVDADQIKVANSGQALQVDTVRYHGWHRWGGHRYWYPHRAWGHRWPGYRHYRYWNDGPYYSPYYRSYGGWRRPYWGWGPNWGWRDRYRPGVTLEFGWP